MSKIIKELGQFADDGYIKTPFGCDAENVFLANGKNLEEFVEIINDHMSDSSSDGNENNQKIPPKNVSDLSIKTGNGTITIYWSDPEDTVESGFTISTWSGTKLVMKAGSYPENITDGTVLVDNKERNTYQTNGFTINNLSNNVTYYFSLFPYSNNGAINVSETNRINCTPKAYRIMTAIIDLSNSNPETCVTYADDATEMIKGDPAWDEFLGYYPVLLDANGNILGNLNPDNYTQYEDGSPAPINVLGSYDVMVAFPKRGILINTNNNKVTVSMTDDPNNENFKYYAHSYGEYNNCDFVYVGAYKASLNDSKIYSCSEQSPVVKQTISTFRTYANNRGSGYEQMTFYVRTFLVCSYLLRFGNLNSQEAVGQGYVNASISINTGATDDKGMNYGTASKTEQIKCLGIEDLWGNIEEWVDGIFSSSTWNILCAVNHLNMNDKGTGYVDNGRCATGNINNYMSSPQGTTELGFIVRNCSGSSTTFFCDRLALSSSSIATCGGCYMRDDNAGVFLFIIACSTSVADRTIGGRLIKFNIENKNI